MIRKLLICPWIGPLPSWYKLWFDNIARLGQFGFDVYVTQDGFDFNRRVKDILGIDYAIGEDGRKVCDYRCAFGLLYADLLDGYDFWGHTDLDMVYGRVENWVTDEVLRNVGVFSNHPTYVSGPFSLYWNHQNVNETFTLVDDWKGYLENPRTTGWVETVFSDMVRDTLTFRFENWQTKNLDDFSTCHWDGDRLMEGRNEIAMLHFRRTKEYPRSLL